MEHFSPLACSDSSCSPFRGRVALHGRFSPGARRRRLVSRDVRQGGKPYPCRLSRKRPERPQETPTAHGHSFGSMQTRPGPLSASTAPRREHVRDALPQVRCYVSRLAVGKPEVTGRCRPTCSHCCTGCGPKAGPGVKTRHDRAQVGHVPTRAPRPVAVILGHRRSVLAGRAGQAQRRDEEEDPSERGVAGEGGQRGVVL